MQFLIGLVQRFVSKEKIIGFVAAVVIAVVAAVVGMSSDQVKSSVCGAPTVQIGTPQAPPAAK